MATGRMTPVIWRVLDDRAGHRNQVLGLTDAIARRIAVDCRDVNVVPDLRGHRSLLPGTIRRLRALPPPDLLIGAGHAAHVPMLSFRHFFGGRAIVLMKPSLPMAAFDLAIVPSVHDLRRSRPDVILTDGPLNRIQRSSALSDSEGLILIGGVSGHFEWSDQQILQQISDILTCDDNIRWTLTTSRRTPATFLKAWQQAKLPGRMYPCEETPPGWLPQMMQRAGRVWVTCESMSMIYEALTAGAAVGLLELPVRKSGRVSRSARQLVEHGQVTAWSAWRDGTALQPLTSPLSEADRCAEEIIRRFLPRLELLPRAA